MSIMLRHDHSYQISVSVKNVGLLIGPLSVKSKDPGSLCKDSLFYWKKTSHFFAARLRHFPASAHTKSSSARFLWLRLTVLVLSHVIRLTCSMYVCVEQMLAVYFVYDAGTGIWCWAGPADNVKCFCCDAGLRNWRVDDSPWLEHARYAPQCSYVQQKCDAAFIANACRPGLTSIQHTASHTTAVHLALIVNDTSSLVSSGTNCLNVFRPVRIVASTAASARWAD